MLSRYFKSLKTKKGLLDLVINFCTVGQNIWGGISNSWSSVGILICFAASHAKSGLDNEEMRGKISLLNRQLDQLEVEANISAAQKQSNKAENDDISDIGLHSTPRSKSTSYILITANLLLAGGSSGLTMYVNETNSSNQSFCTTALCNGAYALGALAFLLAATEQHIKQTNLINKVSKLESRIKELSLQDEINEPNENTPIAVNFYHDNQNISIESNDSKNNEIVSENIQSNILK